MDPERIVVKKYANRRLYDTSNSRYINLEDIAALVRNGKDVQVVDASTGDDLTRVTLTQIIVEDAKGQPSGLPLELLRQLIVASDHVGREFLMWYLKSAFDAYGKVQDSFASRLSDLQSAAASPVQAIRSLFHPAGEGRTDTTEVELLKKRVEGLEAELRSRTKRKPSRQTGTKRRAKRKG